MYSGKLTNKRIVLLDGGAGTGADAQNPKVYHALELTMIDGNLGSMFESVEDLAQEKPVQNMGVFHAFVDDNDKAPELDKEFNISVENQNVEELYGTMKNQNMVGSYSKTIFQEFLKDLLVKGYKVTNGIQVDGEEIGVGNGTLDTFYSKGVITTGTIASILSSIVVKVDGTTKTGGGTHYTATAHTDNTIKIVFVTAEIPANTKSVTMDYICETINSTIAQVLKSTIVSYTDRKIYLSDGSTTTTPKNTRLQLLYIASDIGFELTKFLSGTSKEIATAANFDDIPSAAKPIIKLLPFVRFISPMWTDPSAGEEAKSNLKIRVGASPISCSSLQNVVQNLSGKTASVLFIKIVPLLRNVSISL